MVLATNASKAIANWTLPLVLFVLASGNARAEPIGLMERYALAADREAMLAELIPGSEDYFFYHCLHYQTRGQLEKAEAVLRDWMAEHKGRQTPLITKMWYRQLLLTYPNSPQRTIDELVRRLGVKLDHTAPATQGQRRYPSQLDAAILDTDRLVKEAVQRRDSLKPLGRQHLAELFRRGRTAGISISLKELLAQVDGPYINQLDELVVK
ncbi:MAG: hypothetical protein MI861_14870, partial [Pirellulales bacterium]|nr:hypothetical protein [Pirellulales bacterium]